MRRLLVTTAVVALGVGAAADASVAAPAPREQNSPAQVVPAPSAALRGMLGHPVRTLHHGSPRSAGLLPASIDRIGADVEAGMQPQGTGGHPLYPGGVALAAHDGVVVHESAHGYASLYADDTPTLLPADQRVRTRTDTIYDLASLSKLFTAIVAMQLVDRDRLDLDARVVRYLPAFGSHGKGDITVRQLLTHTSGLAPDPVPGLWQRPAAERVPAILDSVPQAAAGSAYVYSDINMMTVQLIVQAITGTRLDALVRDGITRPLRMTSTMYNPPASLLPRIAATEYERVPDRGMVRGVVHDENAWALDGVAGHAGVFSDADDLAVLAQTLLNGGVYRHQRILSATAVRALMTNLNQAYAGHNHGVGFELYQYFYMGALATPYTIGHTGFTGTTFVVDPTTNSFAILLTNRVHPSRNWGSNNPARRAVADDLAAALPVHPAQGRTSWYAGLADATTSTLTAPLDDAATGGDRLGFALWYDTEPGADVLTLEQSSDGVTWTTLPFALRDHGRTLAAPEGSVSGYARRAWWRADARLAAGTTQLRWTYRTDAQYHGLGIRLDAIDVTSDGTTRFDTARRADAARVRLTGFVPSSH
ncbi:CubicO group peptidase, beta-lactamase class C family [Jatrophihabitans endophyticus]|uniref:CubicO group peptidase, beta-lactamase class C family n=1 Tax=Jatrophihabitans endophyticus TaxID=1206085 RepID=A0A1M5SQD5_9ACTN|nr:serine hydrolase domain-containing protein [Jatrophihabitans endophyticus]SHH40627.1 CubicO group peptidase, beta-lactamase class C family [Jatrophihabitans endophyticus]